MTNTSEKQTPKIRIQLPNILLIPLLSIVFSIIKLCGGVSWDWAQTIVLVPMFTYLGWSFLFLILTVLCIIVVRIAKDFN